MSKTFGATLLVVGTSVGAGMLGLPVETSKAGFFPSILMMVLVWLATTSSALLLADVVIHGKKGVNFFSLSEHYLGSAVRGITLIFYFLLFFSLITAYAKGGGGFISDFFEFDKNSSGSIIFILFFLPFIIFGAYLVEKLNLLFTLILFAFYIALVLTGIGYIDPAFLTTRSFDASFFSIPLIITAFSYHGTLPTIIEYLDRDYKKIRRVVLFGSAITFFIYFIWQLLLIGIIPYSGSASLSTALEADKTAMLYLQEITGSKAVSRWAIGFSFTALTTSFLGVTLGVIDFLCDAFRLKQTLRNRFLISCFTLIPALILSTLKLPIFYFSLKYGAGLSCTFLLLFLPAAMWKRAKIKEQLVFGVSKEAQVKFLYVFSILSFLFVLFDLFRKH